MDKWYLHVRIIPEVNYLMPPGNMAEAVLRRQAEVKVQAMAATLQEHVTQLLVDQINAEIDLSQALHQKIFDQTCALGAPNTLSMPVELSHPRS